MKPRDCVKNNTGMGEKTGKTKTGKMKTGKMKLPAQGRHAT